MVPAPPPLAHANMQISLKISPRQAAPWRRSQTLSPETGASGEWWLTGPSCLAPGWAGQALRRRSPVEVITVWWQDIIIVAVIALGIYGFVVLARYMTQQMTRKTGRRAEDMYDEFDSARKEKDRWPI